VGLTSKMSSRPPRGNGRSSSWVAAVASVSAGAHQPGRSQTWRERSGRSRLRRPGRRRQRRPSARRRPRAASRDPSRLPRSFAGVACSATRPEDAPGRAHARVGKVSFRWGTERRKTIATSVSLFQQSATSARRSMRLRGLAARSAPARPALVSISSPSLITRVSSPPPRAPQRD
jgi:hypothetical protein